MKNSIATMLNAYVFDNEEYIKENGGNVAEYILLDSEDQGWLWFLSEEEIKEFENNQARRDEMIDEIKTYITENYDYNLRADELLEKWIVVKFGDETEDPIRVTRRINFEEMNYCEAYGDYGVRVDCYYAGCYSLDNSQSDAKSDCIEALKQAFTELEKYTIDLDYEIISFPNEEEFDNSEEREALNYSGYADFIKTWRKENEVHTQVTGWTYHDSHNYKTVVSEMDFGEADCVELDEEEQIEILLQMPETAPYMEGVASTVETDDFKFSFDRWATNPWYCFVERK